MTFLPRADRDVTPLSPGVETLLRGISCPAAPGDLKARLLAAHARREAAPRLGLRFRLLAGGVAAAAAAVVLWLGGARGGADAPAAAWETVHPAPRVATAPVRVVDDPSLAGIPSASLVAFDPLEGP